MPLACYIAPGFQPNARERNINRLLAFTANGISRMKENSIARRCLEYGSGDADAFERQMLTDVDDQSLEGHGHRKLGTLLLYHSGTKFDDTLVDFQFDDSMELELPPAPTYRTLDELSLSSHYSLRTSAERSFGEDDPTSGSSPFSDDHCVSVDGLMLSQGEDSSIWTPSSTSTSTPNTDTHSPVLCTPGGRGGVFADLLGLEVETDHLQTHPDASATDKDNPSISPAAHLDSFFKLRSDKRHSEYSEGASKLGLDSRLMYEEGEDAKGCFIAGDYRGVDIFQDDEYGCGEGLGDVSRLGADEVPYAIPDLISLEGKGQWRKW
ncbi:hypothetical protein DFP72DRAFT_885756 [Ephemerocybe angulata]|uniref:Uncharacterized protein n=1 Tax=Ephemerocybe angulata TaxID=980116 RepID=A0A8H6I5S3_9AGAR|nr:hypothetical protein DFP72DRAFT_885756 [Tulosesus angulatus]